MTAIDFQNPKESLKRHLRLSLVGDQFVDPPVPRRLADDRVPDLDWLPDPWMKTTFPSVRFRELYFGRWNKGKRKLEARIQLSFHTAEQTADIANLAAAALLTILGFDLETEVMETDVPRFDFTASPPLELVPMTLEWVSGPEPGPVTETDETHLMMDFKLYF